MLINIITVNLKTIHRWKSVIIIYYNVDVYKRQPSRYKNLCNRNKKFYLPITAVLLSRRDFTSGLAYLRTFTSEDDIRFLEVEMVCLELFLKRWLMSATL